MKKALKNTGRRSSRLQAGSTKAKRRGRTASETAVILPVFFVLVMYALQVATVVVF